MSVKMNEVRLPMRKITTLVYFHYPFILNRTAHFFDKLEIGREA